MLATKNPSSLVAKRGWRLGETEEKALAFYRAWLKRGKGAALWRIERAESQQVTVVEGGRRGRVGGEEEQCQVGSVSQWERNEEEVH